MTTEQHLQEFADLFVKAWAMWAAQEDCTPVEKIHLERAMGDVFWSEMIMKWSEMADEGIVTNPTDQMDAEVDRVKRSPMWMIPEHLREGLTP